MAGDNMCDMCMYLEYDDETEEYVCVQSAMDEDEVARMAYTEQRVCPYYRPGNEYTIVRKQM